MLRKKQIQVLCDLRLILKFTNLYNKNGFYLKYSKRFDPIKIPNCSWLCLFLLSNVWTISLFIWFAIEKKFDLKVISISLATAIGVTQTIISHIFLARKTDLIISTIDHLQEFMEKSKQYESL